METSSQDEQEYASPLTLHAFYPHDAQTVAFFFFKNRIDIILQAALWKTSRGEI